jgi:hypothetical protein
VIHRLRATASPRHINPGSSRFGRSTIARSIIYDGPYKLISTSRGEALFDLTDPDETSAAAEGAGGRMEERARPP